MKPTDTSFPVIEENRDLLLYYCYSLYVHTLILKRLISLWQKNGGENNISEGMYENRVKNDVKIFKIPALLSFKRKSGNFFKTIFQLFFTLVFFYVP